MNKRQQATYTKHSPVRTVRCAECALRLHSVEAAAIAVVVARASHERQPKVSDLHATVHVRQEIRRLRNTVLAPVDEQTMKACESDIES